MYSSRVIQPQNCFQYIVDMRNKSIFDSVLSSILYLLHVFLCFTCKYGVFWVFSINIIRSHDHDTQSTKRTYRPKQSTQHPQLRNVKLNTKQCLQWNGVTGDLPVGNKWHFKYLGSMFSADGDVRRRIVMTQQQRHGKMRFPPSQPQTPSVHIKTFCDQLWRTDRRPDSWQQKSRDHLTTQIVVCWVSSQSKLRRKRHRTGLTGPEHVDPCTQTPVVSG